MRCPLLHFCAALMLALGAAAQTPGTLPGGPPVPAGPLDPRDPVQIVRVDFGWDGVMPSDRWAPVVVWLWSGTGAFSGEAILEYRQDATQKASVVLPVATTPGQIVPFELAACIPQSMSMGASDEVATLQITDNDSNWKREVTFVAVPSRGGEMSAPRIDPIGVRVLIVGDTSASAALITAGASVEDLEAAATATPRAVAPSGGVLGPSGGQDVWARLQPVRRTPSQLPLSWLAYEGIEVVIASADDLAKADPRARLALLDWVRWGGRLILAVDGAGSSWTQMVPWDEALVLADEQRPTVPPGDLFRMVKTKQSLEATRAAVPARVLRLTPAGVREGWRAFWTPEGESTHAGLVVRGPVGMGMVTLLGADPQRLPLIASGIGARHLWRSLLADVQFGALPSYVTSAENQTEVWYWGYSGSGHDAVTSGAITGVLDQVTLEPPVSDLVFVIIAVAMICLGLLVGPFDGLVLRRRGMGRRTWLSALGWIVAASAAAYAAPSLIRSNRAHLCRGVVLDLVGKGPAGPSAEWRTGITGVFSGAPMRASLRPTEGAWWRGVSAMESYRGNARAFASLEEHFDLGETRALAPVAFRQGQWTYRTFLDVRPGMLRDPAGPEVSVVQAGDDWLVEVSNLPPGATINGAVLSLGAAEYWTIDLRPVTTESGHELWAGAASREGMVTSMPTTWSWPRSPDAEMIAETGQRGNVGAGLRLPGARQREEASLARLRSGSWAMLLVSIRGLPDDTGLVMPDTPQVNSLTLVRALVPLRPQDRRTQEPLQ